MDRRLVRTGAVPLAEDWLQPQQDAMAALGALAEAVLGSEVTVFGLAVEPTQPPTLAVRVRAGAIYQMAPLEATAFGELPADQTPIIKQGIQRGDVTLAVQAPPTPGQSRNYLVQAAFSEDDTDPVVLPYFNSQNPAQAYAGPGNSGAAQNTRRRGRVVVQLKAGAPSTTGTQGTPAADTGFIGLAVVTVANGATQVLTQHVANLATVPRPPSNMRLLRPGFANMAVFRTPGSTNWTVPVGVRRLRVRAWGGGGGGGAAASGPLTPPWAGTGGSAGAYAEGIYDVTPGQIITVTVGRGGDGAANHLVSGGVGGTSSFGSMLSAPGGNPGSTTEVTNTNQVVGPVGVGGQINAYGGAGAIPVQNAAIPNTALGGAGGSAPFGGGQGGVASTGGPGQGWWPGGGGGGGGGGLAAVGGAGADGCVIVEY